MSKSKKHSCSTSKCKGSDCQKHGCGTRCDCHISCATYKCRCCGGFMVPPGHSKYSPYSCCIIKEAPKQLLCLRTGKMLNKCGKCC